VVSVRSKGNYKVLVILALLPVANALFFIGAASHAPWTFASLLSGVWLLVLLINLIGGRIIPAFTRNWMKRQVHDQQMKPATLPPQFDRFDLFATALLVVFACLQVAQAPPLATAALGALAAAALTIRLARWQGWRAFGEPLVWVLHVAFAWIPIGIALLAASELDWVPRTAGVHALTSGAITTMIVAVASRAALGHTGRPLASHPLLTASYALITIAAVLRVAATAGPGARILLMLAASAWTLGFLCFAWRYVPILTQASYIRPAQPQR